ncbi:hypothetical protein [Embleya sp. NPDC020630]|uniref:hypothetical protein n=1 Tax=Embleya sp. NPDC020630 TaxID=3363979 RepID=UPI0037B115BD
MKAFFDADPSPRRTFTAYHRLTVGTVVVVRWVTLAQDRWRFRDRLELDTQGAIEALAHCERTNNHDAAVALFAAVSRLPGLTPTELDARISSVLGEDHTQFSRPDVGVIHFVN